MAPKPKHGYSPRGGRMPEYHAWQAMKQRCLNPRNDYYHRYGGRGISVCERWLKSFPNFLSDMGLRPDGMSLERRDNNGNYTPDNCYWANKRAQGRNTERVTCTQETADTIRRRYKAGGISRRLLAQSVGVSRYVVNHVLDRGDWS